MTEHETSPVKVCEAPPGDAVVQQRLHNLLGLAIAIGRREGLIGNNGVEGGQHVADKGNI